MPNFPPSDIRLFALRAYHKYLIIRLSDRTLTTAISVALTFLVLLAVIRLNAAGPAHSQ